LKTIDWLDIIWGVLLIILAIKWFPVIGIFGTLTVVMAGIKIGTSFVDRSMNG